MIDPCIVSGPILDAYLQLHEVLEEMPIAILVANPRGIIVQANKVGRRDLNISGACFDLRGAPRATHMTVDRLFDRKETMAWLVNLDSRKAHEITATIGTRSTRCKLWISHVNNPREGLLHFAMTIVPAEDMRTKSLHEAIRGA